MGYYSTKIRPYIAPSAQHSAFANRDVLFGWTAFQVPRSIGTVKLLSAVVMLRPKGDSGATANNQAFKLWFADDDRTSFGTVDSAQDDRPNRDLLGCLEFSAENEIPMGSNSSVTTMISGPTLDADHGKFDELLLKPKDGLDAHDAGYNTMYIGGIAGGATDWSSINAIAEAGAAEAASTQVITMDGTSMDVREHFAAGDTVAIGTSVGTPAADSQLGVIESVDDATTITLTSVSATELVDGDILYNIHPMEIILNFEY
tara:strand:- start:93 stop:869 length:777 start_codon:yes stop_codon:yes gene_type:complete